LQYELIARGIDLAVFFRKIFNCKRYVEVIRGQFFTELAEEERPYGWFQQGRATAHTGHTFMEALPSIFWTLLSATLFGQHVHPITIVVIFSSGVV
jgi:hypothetical protein